MFWGHTMTDILSDNTDILSFAEKVSGVLSEVERKEQQKGYVSNSDWAVIRNDTVSALPSEVRISGGAASTFLRWKVGYDESKSLGSLWSLFSAIGQSLIGHWGGAASSLAKAGTKAYGEHKSYEQFLDSDPHFKSCAKIMKIYNAEIVGGTEIVLRRAKAVSGSSSHGDRLEQWGGSITP
jgi:hypothetical protein